jgi:hypothetical protein
MKLKLQFWSDLNELMDVIVEYLIYSLADRANFFGEKQVRNLNPYV